MMNSETLKNLQAPLKEKYREQPESAVITLKAEGKIGEGISCNVATAQSMVEAAARFWLPLLQYLLSPFVSSSK